MACVLVVRRAYLRRLLPGVRVEALAARAAIPALAASAAVLAVRLALWGGERPLGQALGELALWCVVLVVLVLRLDGALLRELRGLLREPAPAERA